MWDLYVAAYQYWFPYWALANLLLLSAGIEAGALIIKTIKLIKENPDVPTDP